MRNSKKYVLTEIADSYLLKDVLSLDGVRKTTYFIKLLAALALQMGSEVSLNEIASTTGLNKDTVARYISILEQAYIIFTLPSYSTNERNELRKSKKIYFYDNGIRNAILRNYAQLEYRDKTEVGHLFENYLVSERIKFLAFHGLYSRSYFWRNTQQAEVDYLEESDGKLLAWEFKYNPKKNARITRAFTNLYPNADCKIITTETIIDFLLPV